MTKVMARAGVATAKVARRAANASRVPAAFAGALLREVAGAGRRSQQGGGADMPVIIGAPVAGALTVGTPFMPSSSVMVREGFGLAGILVKSRFPSDTRDANTVTTAVRSGSAALLSKALRGPSGLRFSALIVAESRRTHRANDAFARELFSPYFNICKFLLFRR